MSDPVLSRSSAPVNPFLHSHSSASEPPVLFESGDPNLGKNPDGSRRTIRLWLRNLGADEKLLTADKEDEYLQKFWSVDPAKPAPFPVPPLADNRAIRLSVNLILNCARLEAMQDPPAGEHKYAFLALLGMSGAFEVAFGRLLVFASELSAKKNARQAADECDWQESSQGESRSTPTTGSGETPIDTPLI